MPTGFYPRLSQSDPSAIYPSNSWWYSNGNPYYYYGYGMQNCTCYCYGRTGEILNGFETRLPQLNNGGEWYDIAQQNGLSVGYQPLLGGIMVFKDKPTATIHKDGHVAQVEVINADGSVITSNSGWARPTSPSSSTYFWTETLRPENGFLSSWMDDGSTHEYYYVGCIYVYTQPSPTPTSRRKLPIWMLLRYGI